MIYDAEHFLTVIAKPGIRTTNFKAAIKGGAERVVLCDTNGGSMPWQVTAVVRTVHSAVEIPLGYTPTTTANVLLSDSLAAVREGCTQVPGTVNGYGERCGNANLCSVIRTWN